MNMKRTIPRIVEISFFIVLCWIFIDGQHFTSTSQGVSRFLRGCASYAALSAIILVSYFYVVVVTVKRGVGASSIIAFIVCGLLLSALCLPIRNYIHLRHMMLFAFDAISIILLAVRLPDSARATSWFVGWKELVVTPEDFMEHVKAQEWAARIVVLIIVQSLVFAVIAYFIA